MSIQVILENNFYLIIPLVVKIGSLLANLCYLFYQKCTQVWKSVLYKSNVNKMWSNISEFWLWRPRGVFKIVLTKNPNFVGRSPIVTKLPILALRGGGVRVTVHRSENILKNWMWSDAPFLNFPYWKKNQKVIPENFRHMHLTYDMPGPSHTSPGLTITYVDVTRLILFSDFFW